MNIGEAMQALKDGKKTARAGWHGRGMHIFLIFGDERDKLRDSIGLVTPDGSMQPGWNASTADLLATDWVIVE